MKKKVSKFLLSIQWLSIGFGLAASIPVRAVAVAHITDCAFAADLTTIVAGDTLCFEVDDDTYNVNSGSVDSLLITVSSSGGDSELRELTETGNNTGIFRSGTVAGVPQTDALATNAANSSGVLQVAGSNTIQIINEFGGTPGTPPATGGTQESYWNLDEGTGTTAADSVGSNNGTIANAPTWSAGQFGYAGDYSLTFNGTNQYVDVGTMGSFGSSLNANSFEFWMKSTVTGAQTFFGQSASNDMRIVAGEGFNNSLAPDPNKLIFFIGDGGVTTDTLASTTSAIPTLNNGQWHHIVFTYDNSTADVNIYFDGASQAVSYGALHAPMTGQVNLPDSVYIGGFDNNSSLTFPYTGSIDNVIFYNSVLSAGTVSSHYTAGAVPSTTYLSNEVSVSNSESVTILATIDPTMSFTLSTANCNFGSLSTSTVKACPVLVTISTNSTNGYVAYVRDVNNGTLNSASDTIAAVASSPLSAGTEGFGVATSQASQDLVQETGCTDGASVNSQSITTANQQFASAAAPVDNEASTVCLAAGISALTPAGAYTDTAYITIVGNF